MLQKKSPHLEGYFNLIKHTSYYTLVYRHAF
jgi:hypothetical protein